MNTSDLWRSLANDFQSVPEIREFTASRDYYMGSTQVDWQLIRDQITLAEFNALAARGASMLTPEPTGDLAIAWLEALWHEATHGFVRSTSEVLNQPQFPTEKLRLPVQLRGKIDRVFQSSSTLCRKFESVALQAEFEEKQRNDPRNWSQFRQQYEAFRSIKEIVNEPAERITEEWVRNTVARINGVRPEEVTQQQIRFEISGLLSPTRRHIELVPTAPPQEPPPDAPAEESTMEQVTRESLSIPETIAVQIQRLRLECKWTIEKLAGRTGLDEKTVKRHLSGRVIPHLRNLTVYDRTFSKALKRGIVISQMPPKRPPNAS
jgi:hypothetical protein